MPRQFEEKIIPDGFLNVLFESGWFLNKLLDLLKEEFGKYTVLYDILVNMTADSSQLEVEIDDYLFRIVCIKNFCFRFTILDELSEYHGCSILLSLEHIYSSIKISHVEFDFSTWPLSPQFIAERGRLYEDGVSLYKITFCHPDDTSYVMFFRILLKISVRDGNNFVTERFLEEEKEEEEEEEEENDATIFARLRFEELSQGYY